jgi:small subunit ribosomal protein S20
VKRKIVIFKNMNKKQRNRKIVAQNKRNRIINRRYSSTIKTLLKLFLINSKEVSSEENTATKKIKCTKLVQHLYSLLDKAVKKQVIHKNTASRKKSKIGKLFAQL